MMKVVFSFSLPRYLITLMVMMMSLRDILVLGHLHPGLRSWPSLFWNGFSRRDFQCFSTQAGGPHFFNGFSWSGLSMLVFFNQVGGVVGWLSIKDPEDGGAPQVFSRCVSFHIFLFCLFFYEINTFLRKSSKCVFCHKIFTSSLCRISRKSRNSAANRRRSRNMKTVS